MNESYRASQRTTLTCYTAAFRDDDVLAHCILGNATVDHELVSGHPNGTSDSLTTESTELR